MPAESSLPIFTVGHSGRSLGEFLGLILQHRIEVVVDVRIHPKARDADFNAPSLRRALAEQDVGYLHYPELGGRRKPRLRSPNRGWENKALRGYADYMKSDVFEMGLRGLMELAGFRRVALLCTEAHPKRCHRQLIADALLIRGHRVIHILSSNETFAHRLTSFAQLRRKQLVYPEPVRVGGR